MKDFLLEVCVDSVESAVAAARGGADRLELCSNLVIGGTTPGICLFQAVREAVKLPVHVLIRPRFGDFCYTEAEFKIIKEEIKMFHDQGAQGAVFGILTPDGDLDLERLRIVAAEAEGMSRTLHRAFDVCRDPYEAMEQAVELGFHTILTSGQQDSALKGSGLLRELVEKSRGRISILTGSGVSAKAIRELYPLTGGTAYHMSGKKVLDSAMRYRKDGVNMGLAGMSEYEIWRTEEEAVRAARSVLEEL